MPDNRKYISVKFSEPQFRERNRALSILLEMSTFLSTSMDIKEIWDKALLKVLEWFNLDAGRIYLMEDDGQLLTLTAYKGIEAEGLEKIKAGEGFSGKAVQTRSFIAQHVSELEDKLRAELLAGKGFKIIVCVPLIAMGEVMGVMNLAAREIMEFDSNEIDLLLALGNQLAVAATNIRLYADLKKKVNELEIQKDAIEFFAYSISHDLKSPAIGIYGLTRRLHKQYCEILEDTGRLYCEQILRASEQIVRLVDRINAYIMAKEAPLRFEEIRLKEITEAIRNEFSEVLSRRNVRWSEPESNPAFVADKLCITRMFRNLVDNALKYGGQELTEIRVGFKEEGDCHVISISDDGVALEEKDSEKLFELFHRHKTSKGIEGTGLGLATVKEIAERHQGRVWLESGSEGEGTTFCVSISKHPAS